jgi:adenine-specific DNA methylase
MSHPKQYADSLLEDKEHRWQHVALKNGHGCSVCGQLPTYDERVTYFETGKCGYHTGREEKAKRDD